MLDFSYALSGCYEFASILNRTAVDSDIDFTISNKKIRKLGYNDISVVSINLRRKKSSGRRRVGYDNWRYNFDRLRAKHNKY